jgi:hypothetical protein
MANVSITPERGTAGTAVTLTSPHLLGLKEVYLYAGNSFYDHKAIHQEGTTYTFKLEHIPAAGYSVVAVFEGGRVDIGSFIVDETSEGKTFKKPKT